MSSPSTPAIRSRLSLHTAVTVLFQLAAFFALSACAWPQPALAQVPTVTLTFRTADLGTKGGVQGLYHRIERAARQVCPEYDSLNLHAASLSLDCQRRAIADAVRQIGNPRLAAISSAIRSPQG
jgi:UrcA family protein